MSLRIKLALGIGATTFAILGFGCGPQEATPIPTTGGSGGNSGETSATGGAQSSGGTSTTTTATGGEPGRGGSGSGGRSATGGESGSGGSSTATGGASAAGGRSTSGLPGTGGRTRPGGASGTAGRTGSGGSTVIGGTTSTGAGGTTSTAGSTGTVALPAKFVGNIDTRGSIRSDFSKYWNQFSPENAGKWGSVQGSSQSSFNWSSLDAMYKYCNDNNIVFKQHNFIWGAQQPGWTSSLSTSTGPTAVQNWMTQFCTRYPKVAIIDVVNEPPPHTTPAYANAIGGGTNSTWDWIANAFKWARQACPNAVLVLNDYNNDELSGDVQHTSDIVNAIKKLNAPIDAVGCQTHGASNMGSSTLKTNIDKIASNTGLGIYITEYDINLADDNAQAAKYQDHFTMFMSNNNVKGVTIWGYIVGATWQTNTGIMQSSGTMRPAMTWLMSFLKR